MGIHFSAVTLMLMKEGSFMTRRSWSTRLEARNTSQVRASPARLGALSMRLATTIICCLPPARDKVRSAGRAPPACAGELGSPSAARATASSCCPAAHLSAPVTGITFRCSGAASGGVAASCGPVALPSVWHSAIRLWWATRRTCRSAFRKLLTSSISGMGAPSNTFTVLVAGPISCTSFLKRTLGSDASLSLNADNDGDSAP
mmetsp:Transcript_39326/g.111399  ORF Transcript_39326/g.111399 Transcript_39326/m.111399 type:complete len:203 (+) Transcript_39326:2087-2695(+)